MSMTIEELKMKISREINLVPENGVTDEHGNWTSKENEVERLERLLNDITYFLREYS